MREPVALMKTVAAAAKAMINADTRGFVKILSDPATGVVLGAGRAIGETMAVLMVCGNVVQTPASLFDPVRSLAVNIALEMAYALGDHRSALFVSGLVLLAMIAALIGIAERLRRHAGAHAPA